MSFMSTKHSIKVLQSFKAVTSSMEINH